MALAMPQQTIVMGSAKPRLAPPVPARHDARKFTETAAAMGIPLMPWQKTAARYLTAKGPGDRLLYREVCIVVARQNGKTTLMKPLIIRALRAGKRVLHVAQNRELPRQMFGIIADALSNEEELFQKRRGRTIWPRYGSGQEEIALANGGWYRIAAANRGGGRGWPTDLVVIDELREMKSFEVISAIEPTLTMSTDPQMVYLSNAGDDDSVVLNAVRERAGKDPALAYLEWSSAPERASDDVEGWAESNPAMGHFPPVMESLEHGYQRHSLAGTLAIFDTEYRCLWAVSLRPSLVSAAAWNKCYAEKLSTPQRPVMAVSLDPLGTRASAVLAWPSADKVALQVLYDVPGHPIDVDRLGKDLRSEARKYGVTTVGFDPLTDAQLARYFPRKEPITGQKYANASSRFVSLVESERLGWTDAVQVGEDLVWTARKPHEESGAFQAVRASDDRPITASLAAIRASWLASEPVREAMNRPPQAAGF